MATYDKHIPWERLAPPPRDVPRAVRTRVRLAEITLLASNFSGWQGFIGVAFGTALTGFGVLWFNAAEEADYPGAGLALALLGAAILLQLVAAVYRRGSRRIAVLRYGTLVEGTITHVWYNVKYYDYEALVGPWRKPLEQILAARKTNPAAGWQSLTFLRLEFRTASCKVRVQTAGGGLQEIKMRLDLLEHMSESNAEPNIQVLCDPSHVNDGIVASQIYPWLALTQDGQWSLATKR